MSVLVGCLICGAICVAIGWQLRNMRSDARGTVVAEQESTIERCPTCGTTNITFDPPLVFEAAEACGALKPGNWAAGYLPTCEMPAGHDGKHVHLVERTETW